MKKIVIMLVCAAFLLSGCGKKENEVEPPSDTGKSYVEFVQTDYAVGVDAEIQLTLNSENAESITFVSSLPEIASVSPNGVVSGLKLGRTEITATAVSTGKGGERLSAKCSVFVNPGEYEKLDGEEPLVKWLGRTFVSENAVNCYNTASGFEADFYGTEFCAQILAAGNKKTPRICVLIDDEISPEKRIIDLTQTNVEKEYVLAENLSMGQHKFRVYKLTEPYTTSLAFTSLKTDGYFLNRPLDKPLKIEVYGDSITTGHKNMRTTPAEPADSTDNIQNGCLTYAWLAAEELNAEINVMARTGIGMYSAWGSSYVLRDNWKKTYLSEYDYLHTPLRNPEWDFTSYVPDVVLINIGTNDYWYQKDVELYKSELKKFTDELFSLYGADTKIVYLGGMMIAENIPAMKAVADLYEENVTVLRLPASEASHPRKADNVKAGQVLAEYLEKIM